MGPKVTRTLSATALAVVLGLLLAVSAQADLGFSTAGFQITGPDGQPSLQAGAHPDLTTEVVFNNHEDPDTHTISVDGSPRDVIVDLPPGFVGNPTAAPECKPAQFASLSCPLSTEVGVIQIFTGAPLGQYFGSPQGTYSGIFNLTHGANVPARFGFNYIGATGFIDPSVRPGDYGITAASIDISQAENVDGFRVTLWGVPGDPANDGWRTAQPPSYPHAPTPSPLPPRPFLTAPTSCGPLSLSITADSWEHPEQRILSGPATDLGGTPLVTQGCDKLSFDPSISVQATSDVAGAPTGLNVDLKVPQREDPYGLATPNLRNAVVRLPAGMSVSASSAAGLGACAPAEIGLGLNAAPSCPDSSKIGTVEIVTPLLAEALKGDVILAKQGENPFGSLLALYLAVKGPGFYLKLPGKVEADPISGQLTATFEDEPQLPFSELKLAFNGGSQAPLSNPKACGTYHTSVVLTSWASEAPVDLDPSFTVDQSCDAGGQFTPSLNAGLVNATAGVGSPFTLTLSRPDGQQDINGLSVTLPAGLLGNVGSVPLCPDAQAAAGSCASASRVGSVAVAVGAGGSPVSIPQPGKAATAVYLAGPYKGAPFSLSIVVPAQAGPFDLGSVVVRAGIFIDPGDAHVTVVSDPIPTILQGIPLDVQRINVTLDRAGFMVSPTSCDPTQIAARVSSSQGAVVGVSSRFQVGGCKDLAFAPKLTASVQGKASRKNGASLSVKLVDAAGGANIRSVKVDLPKQLPSRLTTLQRACVARVFEANPANCPAASIVGHATATTSVLSVPVSGPAYFVSHGGEAFPSLVVVLQGDGVTIDLVGTTFISRAGITSSTFKQVPDVPVRSFELTLPTGQFSALAANVPAKARYSLCSQSLVMPTAITGQNGAVLKPNTKITTTGCPKAKKQTKTKKK